MPVVHTLLHDISFGLDFGRTDCWHSCARFCWFRGSSQSLPACSRPRPGMCRSTGVLSVRDCPPSASVRPSVHLAKATSATKHLTFSTSIVELDRKRRNKFLGSPPQPARPRAQKAHDGEMKCVTGVIFELAIIGWWYGSAFFMLTKLTWES